MEALADQNIPFTVKGKTTYEQQMAAIRGAAPPPVQQNLTAKDRQALQGDGQDRAALGPLSRDRRDA